MNKGVAIALGIVACAGALTIVVLSFAVAQEQQGRLAAEQKVDKLKDQMATLYTEAKKLIDVKPIPQKQIVGFGRDLTTN